MVPSKPSIHDKDVIPEAAIAIINEKSNKHDKSCLVATLQIYV